MIGVVVSFVNGAINIFKSLVQANTSLVVVEERNQREMMVEVQANKVKVQANKVMGAPMAKVFQLVGEMGAPMAEVLQLVGEMGAPVAEVFQLVGEMGTPLA